MLILHESELLRNLSRFYLERGELDLALDILSRTLEGYRKMPISEMFKEITLSEIHNLLVSIYLKKGDFDAALAASEEAVEVAKRQSGDSQLPYSIYLRALALKMAKGDNEESLPLIMQAYFAFALLKKNGMKRRVLNDAKEVFGMTFETYGTENIVNKLPKEINAYDVEATIAVDSLGQLLRHFRLVSGARQVDIYKGICSQSVYSKIENGERTGAGIFILDALMQRLGRDMNRYIEYFTSIDEWNESNLRMQYLREMYIGNIVEAEETFNKLSKLGDFSHGLGKQFKLFSQAIMKEANGDFENYTSLLHDAIKETIPDFCEDRISEFRLTFNECNILEQLAKYYAMNGQRERCIEIYLKIKESMDKFYVDDSVKAVFYSALMDNLSTEYYNIGQYEKSLEYADEAEKIVLNHGVLFLLNPAAHRKALCLHKLGRKDEAFAYAAMAYYSGHLTMGEADLEALAKFAKEDLGIEFSGKIGFEFHKEKKGTYRD